jgi:hypothetical protein
MVESSGKTMASAPQSMRRIPWNKVQPEDLSKVVIAIAAAS